MVDALAGAGEVAMREAAKATARVVVEWAAVKVPMAAALVAVATGQAEPEAVNAVAVAWVAVAQVGNAAGGVKVEAEVAGILERSDSISATAR